MSQLPPDVLAQRQQQSSIQRNRAPRDAGRQQIGSLNAPGVAALPPKLGPNSLQTLAGALGVVGQVARIAENYTDEQIAIVRGDAARAVADRLPAFISEIESGAITTPDSMDAIGNHVDSLVAGTLDEGVSRAYADEYRNRLRPALISAITQKHAINQKENDNSLTAATLDGVAFKTDQQDLEDASIALQTSLYFKMGEDQADTEVGLHAAKVAAEAGNVEAFEAAAQFMGEREQLAMTQYRNRLDQRVRQEQTAAISARESDVESQLATIYNEVENSGTPIPAEKARQIIRNGGTSEPHQRQLFDQLKSRVASQFNSDMQALVDEQVEGFRNGLLAHIGKVMDDPAREGSVLRAMDGQEVFVFEDAADKEHKWTLNELMDEFKMMRLRQIEQTVPADQVILAQADFLTNADTTNPVWIADLEAGYSTAATGWARILEDGATAGIPQRLTNAFQLYKQLGEISTKLRDSHVKSDGVRAMFEVAELAERYGNDEGQALLMATRALSPRGAYQSPEQYSVSKTAVAEAVADAGATESGHLWWAQEARNSTEVMAAVQQRAQFYVASLGLDPDTAVEEAGAWVNEHRTIVNGWSYDFGNTRLPEGTANIVGQIATDYAATHGDEGVDASDLSLIPWPDTSNTWVLFNNTTNMPVDDWQDNGTFTSIGLERLAAAMAREKQRAERDESLAATLESEQVRQRQSEGRYTIGELITESAKTAKNQSLDKLFKVMASGSFITRRIVPENFGGIDTSAPTSVEEAVAQTRGNIEKVKRDFNTWWDNFKLGADTIKEGASFVFDNPNKIPVVGPNVTYEQVRELLDTEVQVNP